MTSFIIKIVYYLSGAIVGYYLGKIDAPVGLLILELIVCIMLMYLLSVMFGLV